MESLPNLTLSVSTRARTNTQRCSQMCHMCRQIALDEDTETLPPPALLSVGIRALHKQTNKIMSVSASRAHSRRALISPFDASWPSNRLRRTFQNFLLVESFSI